MPMPTSAYSRTCRRCFSARWIWWLPQRFITPISAKQLNPPGRSSMRLESKEVSLRHCLGGRIGHGKFSGGKSLPDYTSDAMLRSAVERQLEIVGEALAQLSRIDLATASKISEHQRIIAFRNI